MPSSHERVSVRGQHELISDYVRRRNQWRRELYARLYGREVHVSDEPAQHHPEQGVDTNQGTYFYNNVVYGNPAPFSMADVQISWETDYTGTITFTPEKRIHLVSPIFCQEVSA